MQPGSCEPGCANQVLLGESHSDGRKLLVIGFSGMKPHTASCARIRWESDMSACDFILDCRSGDRSGPKRCLRTYLRTALPRLDQACLSCRRWRRLHCPQREQLKQRQRQRNTRKRRHRPKQKHTHRRRPSSPIQCWILKSLLRGGCRISDSQLRLTLSTFRCFRSHVIASEELAKYSTRHFCTTPQSFALSNTVAKS